MPGARLKARYNDEIRAALKDRFGYSSIMEVPKLVKVTLNMGVGEAKQDRGMLEAAQTQLGCARLCFVGSADEITYDERWGGVTVSMAAPVIGRRAELEALGWEVRVLEGLDHTQAMQAAHVLPILRPWLTSTLGGT